MFWVAFEGFQGGSWRLPRGVWLKSKNCNDVEADFLKICKIRGSVLDACYVENRILEFPRWYPRQSQFSHRFWRGFGAIFEGLGTSKIRFSYGNGAFFAGFRALQDEMLFWRHFRGV